MSPHASRVTVSVLLGALVVTAAAAARWRRLSRASSGPDIDATVAAIHTDLSWADLSEGESAAIDYIVQVRDPEIPDRPWFWFAASTCCDDTHNHDSGSLNVVHDLSGYAPSRAAAEAAANDAMFDLNFHPDPESEYDDEDDPAS